MKEEVIETVLKEILDEQKQLNDKVSAYTNLIMQLNEKLNTEDNNESMNLKTLNERLRTIQMACMSIPDKITLSAADRVALQVSLETIIQKSRLAGNTSGKQAYIKVSAIVILLLLVTNILMVYLYRKENKQRRSYYAGNLKYKYLKLQPGKSLTRSILFTDSLFLANPDSLEGRVQNSERNPDEWPAKVMPIEE